MNKQAFAAVGVLVAAVGVYMFFRWKNNQTPATDGGTSRGTAGPPTNAVQLPPVFKAPITTNLTIKPSLFVPTTTSNAGNVQPMPSGTSAWGSVIERAKASGGLL